MKKHLIILLVLFCGLRSTAQDTAALKRLAKAYKSIDSVRTQDGKLNFAKKITALGSFINSEDDALTFKATLFGLFVKNKVDDNYTKRVFERNFEIDLSATPNSSVFKYSEAAAGFTYAIINNASVTKGDYEKLVQTYQIQEKKATYYRLLQVLAELKIAHPDWGSKIDELLVRSTPDKVVVPADLGRALVKAGFKNGGDVFVAADKLFADLQEKVKYRPLLTIGPKVNYDGELGWAKNVSVKGNLTLTSLNKQGDRKIEWSLTPAYTLSTDTAMKTSKLSRKIFNTDLSVNFTVLKDANGKPSFEIKPALGYTNTKGGLYKDEKENAWSFATKLTWKINDDFSLPVTFKVTQNNPNLLGFLSVQYSL